MKMTVTKLNESYVAGEFERLYEEKIASFFEATGYRISKNCEVRS